MGPHALRRGRVFGRVGLLPSGPRAPVGDAAPIPDGSRTSLGHRALGDGNPDRVRIPFGCQRARYSETLAPAGFAPGEANGHIKPKSRKVGYSPDAAPAG